MGKGCKWSEKGDNSGTAEGPGLWQSRALVDRCAKVAARLERSELRVQEIARPLHLWQTERRPPSPTTTVCASPEASQPLLSPSLSLTLNLALALYFSPNKRRSLRQGRRTPRVFFDFRRTSSGAKALEPS